MASCLKSKCFIYGVVSSAFNVCLFVNNPSFMNLTYVTVYLMLPTVDIIKLMGNVVIVVCVSRQDSLYSPCSLKRCDHLVSLS